MIGNECKTLSFEVFIQKNTTHFLINVRAGLNEALALLAGASLHRIGASMQMIDTTLPSTDASAQMVGALTRLTRAYL